MKATLEAINQMQADGVIAHYAIGGAVGSTYYLEPAATLNLEVFVILPFVRGGSPDRLGQLREYVVAQGCTVRDEHMVIAGWPVQFIVPNNELEQAAVVGSVPVTFEDIRIWVMLSEHLVAIALHAGKPQDNARVLQFIEGDVIDGAVLQSVLQQHGLTEKWKSFERIYVKTFPSKETLTRLAALSFPEKVAVLEKLRTRDR